MDHALVTYTFQLYPTSSRFYNSPKQHQEKMGNAFKCMSLQGIPNVQTKCDWTVSAAVEM